MHLSIVIIDCGISEIAHSRLRIYTRIMLRLQYGLSCVVPYVYYLCSPVYCAAVLLCVVAWS